MNESMIVVGDKLLKNYLWINEHTVVEFYETYKNFSIYFRQAGVWYIPVIKKDDKFYTIESKYIYNFNGIYSYNYDKVDLNYPFNCECKIATYEEWKENNQGYV